MISSDVVRKIERGPPEVDLPGGVHPGEVEPEPECGEQRQADAGGQPAPAAAVLDRREPDAEERAGDPCGLGG